MCTTYPYAEPRNANGRPIFYARFRTIMDGSGQALQVQTTRYTWKLGKRPVTGPRGGRDYQEFARVVYYASGTFYRAANVQDESGKWFNAVVPVDGSIWDAHPAYTRLHGDAPAASIVCRHGRPVQVTDGTATYWTEADGLDYLEALLHLDRKPRRRAA